MIATWPGGASVALIHAIAAMGPCHFYSDCWRCFRFDWWLYWSRFPCCDCKSEASVTMKVQWILWLCLCLRGWVYVCAYVVDFLHTDQDYFTEIRAILIYSPMPVHPRKKQKNVGQYIKIRWEFTTLPQRSKSNHNRAYTCGIYSACLSGADTQTHYLPHRDVFLSHKFNSGILFIRHCCCCPTQF